MTYKVDKDNAVVNFEAKEAIVSDEWRFGITQARAGELLKLAVADGFKATSETVQGLKGQQTRAISQYINLAIDRLVEFRKSAKAPAKKV